MHRKVQCWLFSRGPNGMERCLLLKTIAARGAFWQPVTGSVEEGEDFAHAARREVLEETGIDVPGLQDTGFDFEFESRDGTARERVFGGVVAHGTVRLDPKEHDSYRWTDLAGAASMLRFPSNMNGLKQAARLVLGKAQQ